MKTDRIGGRPAGAGTQGRALARWYRRHRRDLPWRRTGDPYAIWVSEVMLQQTTVGTVIPYWKRFLERFPDVETLAAAPLDDVLAAWSGLGYYRRARNLHAAARALVETGARSLPRTAGELRALPGIGEYTAAAIASIAFGEPVPVLDGNVVRVLTRLTGDDGDPARAATRARLRALGSELLRGFPPGEINQALMELGATVCLPREPDCPACPWQDACVAHRERRTGELPRSAPRRGTIAVLRAAARVRRRDGALLLARVSEGRPNAGLWELPSVTLHHAGRDRGRAPARPGTIARRAGQALRRELALAIELEGAPLARIRHAITHHRITVHLFDGRLCGRAPRRESLRWWHPESARPALTGATRRLLARLADG